MAPQNKDRVILTEDQKNLLRHHIERTGIGPKSLMEKADDSPEELNSALIYRWLSDAVKTARQDHYDYVITSLKNLPSLTERFVILTPSNIALLKKHKDRTGQSAGVLLSRAERVPTGLNANKVSNWLNGVVQKANKAEYEFMLWLWQEAPDKAERIVINNVMLRALRQQRVRTDIGPMALLRGTKHERPSGLTSTLIGSWLSGKTKSVRKDHWEYVFEKWADLPDKEDQ